MTNDNFGLPPWDGKDTGKKFWTDRVRGMRDMANDDYLKEDFDQTGLPLGDESVIRILTIRMATRRRHWLDNPLSSTANSILVVNCAADPQYIGSTADICPICAYALHRGNRKSGGADLEIKYFMLVIKGKIENIKIKDSETGLLTEEEEIKWDYEPIIFSCTDGIFKSITGKIDDTEHPKGAKGDITAYAFRINKYLKTPGKPKTVRYSATPYGVVSGISEEVNKELLPDLWERIRKICRPGNADALASKLGVSMEHPIEQNVSQEPSPSQTKPNDNIVSIENESSQPAGTSDIGGELELEPEANTSENKSEEVVKKEVAEEDDIEGLF